MVDAEPDSLLTIEEASTKYGTPYNTLLQWVHRGKLTVVARQKFPARGGGKILIDEAELQYLLAHPPAMGRPRKGVER